MFAEGKESITYWFPFRALPSTVFSFKGVYTSVA